MEECLHDISLDKDADRLIQRFINQVKMYREHVR
jgi:hypothetical protein